MIKIITQQEFDWLTKESWSNMAMLEQVGWFQYDDRLAILTHDRIDRGFGFMVMSRAANGRYANISWQDNLTAEHAAQEMNLRLQIANPESMSDEMRAFMKKLVK